MNVNVNVIFWFRDRLYHFHFLLSLPRLFVAVVISKRLLVYRLWCAVLKVEGKHRSKEMRQQQESVHKNRFPCIIIMFLSIMALSLERRMLQLPNNVAVTAFSSSAWTTSSYSMNRRSSRRRQPLFPTSTRNQYSRMWMATGSGSASPSSTFQDSLAEIKRNYEQALELYQANLQSTPKNVHQILQDLERESSDPHFWDAENKDRNSIVTAQISQYTRLQNRLQNWETWKGDAEVALEMMQDDSFTQEEKASFLEELQSAVHQLLKENERYQLELLLSGPYDDQPCRLILTAGAGGTESNDWVADLRRMYERHAERMGFSCVVEDSQPGDVVGYKSVELMISGGPGHPYGWFKGEKGAHRLVRLSPFNANNKRQTTFAGVDVAPVLMDETSLQSIEIPEKDLEITTMRSGGAGGQNVNKVNSAVRIKHLPSGLNVKCTQERSQALNKDLAMKRLKAQLLAIAKEQRVAEIQEIRGDQVEASWGAQIRNYVLHPYKIVKDQRTNWETSDTQGFLDGDLEGCIAAYLRFQANQEQEAALQEN